MKDIRPVLDIIDTQIWQFTDPETYGIVNLAHAEFFGLTIKQLENKRPRDVLPEKAVAALSSGNQKIFDKATTIHALEKIENSNGQPRDILITKIPKLNNNKGVEYVVCTGTDVTEYNKTEGSIKKVGEICHDMNQQMQAISGYCELLNMDLEKDSTVSAKLNIITENINTLKDSIRRLQKSSRIKSD
jgi:PAS domain S-box-containing protein